MKLTKRQLIAIIRESIDEAPIFFQVRQSKRLKEDDAYKGDPAYSKEFPKEEAKEINVSWRKLRRRLRKPSPKMLATLGWWAVNKAGAGKSLDPLIQMIAQKYLQDSYLQNKKLPKMPRRKPTNETSDEEAGLYYAHTFVKSGSNAFKAQIKSAITKNSLEYKRQIIEEFIAGAKDIRTAKPIDQVTRGY